MHVVNIKKLVTIFPRNLSCQSPYFRWNLIDLFFPAVTGVDIKNFLRSGHFLVSRPRRSISRSAARAYATVWACSHAKTNCFHCIKTICLINEVLKIKQFTPRLIQQQTRSGQNYLVTLFARLNSFQLALFILSSIMASWGHRTSIVTLNKEVSFSF